MRKHAPVTAPGASAPAAQLGLALVVTAEGLPLTYQVFPGNTHDATTLRPIIDTIEAQYGRRDRLWVFDRGLVSEENLDLLNAREVGYWVGTPRHRLDEFERELVQGDWKQVSGRPGVRVQLIERQDEIYVLARSEERAQKELAMRRRVLGGLSRDLRALSRSVRKGYLVNQRKIDQRLGRIQERWPTAWRYLQSIDAGPDCVIWKWDSAQLRRMKLRDGAYLLRSNLARIDPEILWRQYVQLTEVEEAFRVLKSELNLRPIWHRIDRRVPGIRVMDRSETEAARRGQLDHPGSRAGEPDRDPDGGSVVRTARRTADLPAADYRTRSRATMAVAPFEMVIAGAAAAQNLSARREVKWKRCGRPEVF